MLQNPLLLHVKLASKLHQLILLNQRLIVEDLSQLLLVLLQLICVLLHVRGFLPHLLHLVIELFVFPLEQRHLLLKVLDLALKAHH